MIIIVGGGGAADELMPHKQYLRLQQSNLSDAYLTSYIVPDGGTRYVTSHHFSRKTKRGIFVVRLFATKLQIHSHEFNNKFRRPTAQKKIKK
jgi:hypothetical protein